MKTQLNDIVQTAETVPVISNLETEERLFALEQRKAQAMISGSILPQHFKNVGDVLILNEMSRKLNIPSVMLAQQLYIVKGKPSMSGQLVIAIINGSKRFDSIMKWEEEIKPKWRMRAYNSINGEVVYGDWLDDEAIKLNGWGSNPKWATMKNQMARYRTASWFGRLYASDVLLGFHTEGEIEEIIEAEIEEPKARKSLMEVD